MRNLWNFPHLNTFLWLSIFLASYIFCVKLHTYSALSFVKQFNNTNNLLTIRLRVWVFYIPGYINWKLKGYRQTDYSFLQPNKISFFLHNIFRFVIKHIYSSFISYLFLYSRKHLFIDGKSCVCRQASHLRFCSQ